MDNMYITNGFCGKRRSIAIDWNSIDADTLEMGTPVSENGQISNNEKAIGITVRSITRRYETCVDILIAGFIDSELLAISLSDDCRRALRKIAVVEDGEIVPLPSSGGGEYILPTASETVKGGILIGDGLSVDGNGVCHVSVDAVAG